MKEIKSCVLPPGDLCLNWQTGQIVKMPVEYKHMTVPAN